MRIRPRPSAPPIEWAMRLASSRIPSAPGPVLPILPFLVPAVVRSQGYCSHCVLRVNREAPKRPLMRLSSRPYSTFISSLLPGQLLADDANYDEEPSSRASAGNHVLSHLKRRGPFLPAVKPGDPVQPPGGIPLQPKPAQAHHDQLVVSANHYGRWSKLLFDYDQLMFESGLDTEPPHQGKKQKRQKQTRLVQRSVDSPEHFDDIKLWSAIFNFAQRRGGVKDAFIVWQEIAQRVQLFQVDGTVAHVFWETVVATALEDDLFLESTWAYAEWMLATHGAEWPKYYESIVTHFIGASDYKRALLWHVRLSPNFALPKRSFFAMLKGFLVNGGANRELHETLQYIYVTSHQRSLYDTIVPLLWSQGNSEMARDWREMFITNRDLPSSAVSRPFLQFLHSYYPETELDPQEDAVMHSRLDTNIIDEAAAAASRARAGAALVPGSQHNLFHFMNQVHGETFGIKEKKVFDDKMGSKWFATKFVSLDTAINLVYTLGVSEIGPLSLQSIALREGTPAGVLHRIEQLEQSQISIGQSSYSTAIRHLAKQGDAETLMELLQCMIDPEVFDNIVLQRQIMGMASFKGDWKTYRMILVVRVATSDASIGTSSNRMLLTCLERGKKALVLKLLDEFAARDYVISPSTCHAINRDILSKTLPIFDKNNPPDVDFYAALCRRMAAMRLPVPTQAWRNIMYIYGRNGRLYKTENTALSVVRSYINLQKRAVGKPLSAAASAKLQTAAGGSGAHTHTESAALSDDTSAFKVYVGDVPEILKEDEAPPDGDIGFRLLPRDLRLNHPLHPLSMIFEENLIRSLVRWYFHRMGSYRRGNKMPLKLPESEPESAESDAWAALEVASQQTSRAGTAKAAKKKPKKKPNKEPAVTNQPAITTHKEPVDYSFAAGIRVIAMLRDRGVDVSTENVRSEALVCILALFGPDSNISRVWKTARANNQATLSEVKLMCDAAWSDPTSSLGAATQTKAATLLPPLSTIEAALEALKPISSYNRNQISKPKSEGRRESEDVFLKAAQEPGQDLESGSK